MITLRQINKMFKVYLENLNKFKDTYYLISPFTEVVHVNFYNTDPSCLINVHANSPSYGARIISWRMLGLMSIDWMTCSKKKPI